MMRRLGKFAGASRLDSCLQTSLEVREGYGDGWDSIEVMGHQDQAEGYRDDGHGCDPEGEKTSHEDGHHASSSAIT
jgi:hypothetical protein